MHEANAIYDHVQHDFPLQPRPFQCVADALGLREQDVLARFARDMEAGRISRIGAVFAPNVIGASTLAALAVPPALLDQIADRVSADASVSHNYARAGHPYNLWFVAGERDRPALDAALARIAADTGCPLLDLPLEREYHIDLGFSLSDHTRAKSTKRVAKVPAPQHFEEADWRLVAALEGGLPLVAQPYDELARRCGLSAGQVMARLAQWCGSGVIRRFGVVLHHRRFGFRSNAMCVWDLPDEAVDAAGAQLAALPQVTLCYRRTRRLPHWPYNLFAMVHARDAQEVQAAREIFVRQDGPAGAPGAMLVSTRCYKQRATRYAAERSAA